MRTRVKWHFCTTLALGTACGDDESVQGVTCLDASVPKTTLPEVPMALQTDHFDLYSEGFVCTGTAMEVERHALFVANTIDIDLRTHIPLVLSAEKAPQCGDRSACTTPDGTVFTTPSSIHHEINHSVACQLRTWPYQTVPALIEGFAVMFEPRDRTRRYDDVELIDLLDSHSYFMAGHFMRWLLEREGAEALAQFYLNQDSDGIIDVIENIYGTDINTLEQEYRATSPWAWVPFRQCTDIPHIERDGDGVWKYSAIMDCADEMTLGPYLRNDPILASGGEWNWMYQSFTISVDEAMDLDYTLSEDALYALLEHCPGPDEHPTQPPSVEDGVPFARALMRPKVNGSSDYPFLSSPGIWRVDVVRLHGPPAPTELSFWKRPDP